MVARQAQQTDYQARRLTIPVDAPFDDFRQRYEAAVPPLDTGSIVALVERRADWSEVVETARRQAPHDFFIFWSLDAQPLMGLAGSTAQCVEYLMGNHVVAERMFRHDPTVLAYVPLHLAIAQDEGGTTLTIDQPSHTLGSYGHPEITMVAVDLDHKLGRLLQHLGVPVPPSLMS
ncbi:hypothetical protein BDK92_1985 [Micromonospora pisi]|uniref:DUF302 domain-containing protein n=1 Tax=Micromonospora pisi TaxID=589240 RepID=A0A495JFM9_9ACTN|nr:DUF302 domain-containing protein [Micromonospora pisi]RKR87693.1 hypothetical protein BDK92_1985 [Micromonospora pisi]